VIFVITNCVLKEKNISSDNIKHDSKLFFQFFGFPFQDLFICVGNNTNLLTFPKLGAIERGRVFGPDRGNWVPTRNVGTNKYCSGCSQCCVPWNMSTWLLAGLYRSNTTLMFCF